MATEGNNLSEYNIEKIPNGADFRVGIVVSEWNEDITSNLLLGAKETLLKHGVKASNLIVKAIPGTFELPLAAQMLYEVDKTIDGVICIGSVIQGQTKHFDFVCEAAALGIKDVNLKYNKPTIFCVLTDNNKQQAIDRSGGVHGNKGTEGAVACLKMIHLMKSL